jgi:flagellar hook-associated protein 1 FlgK
MTIQGTLLNALSSLAAEQRQAAVIANNVANANTPGYVRRELPRSEQLTAGRGTGVDTAATQRIADEALAAAARASSGDAAYGQRMAEALANLTAVIGQPSDGRSLSTALGNFRAALTTLSAAPDNAVAQNQAVEAAEQLVSTFHQMDSAISDARTAADLGVARDVEAVNSALEELAKLDKEMGRAAARGESLAEFQDRRDLLLTDIAKRVPVRVHDGGPGRLIVTTDQGTTLYDSGTVHRLSFTHTAAIPSDLKTGLGAVTVDGVALRSGETGSIAAGLQLRDVTLPRYADMLNQVAGNLMHAAQTADPSLASPTTDAGLFTVGSATSWNWDPLATDGLARGITVHPAIDAANLYRMRDGVAATTPGLSSDNSGILAFLEQMDTAGTYTPSTGLPFSLSLSDATAQATGLMQAERASWANRAETRNALDLQAQQELANKTGVNVDEELQRLLLVQQTHAASVQVIQAASKMLDDLVALRN